MVTGFVDGIDVNGSPQKSISDYKPLPAWLIPSGSNSHLRIHVQPKASKSEIAGEYGQCLKIRICAPPVDGKANQALIRFVARVLGIPRRAVTLEKGQSSRRKLLFVRLPPEKVRESLQ